MNKKYLVFVGMGFELVGLILASIYIGQIVDAKYNSQGLGIAGFSMLSLAGWIIHIVALTKKIDQSDETKGSETE